MQIRCPHHPEAPEIETAELADCLDPLNCAECGCRLGWADADSNDASYIHTYCDCCARDYSEWRRA